MRVSASREGEMKEPARGKCLSALTANYRKMREQKSVLPEFR